MTLRFAVVATIVPAFLLHGQFWDKMKNPRITVALQHPPGLGLNIKRIAFGPASGECSDQVIDMVTEQLVPSGIEVLDRQNLQSILAEHHFNLSGYVDQSSAMELGKLLGPTALVFVKVTRCVTEQRSLYETANNVRVNISRTRAYIHGSVQTVDLTTGRVFAAQTVDFSPWRENRSADGVPEFPSDMEVKDEALRAAASQAVRLFVPWSEQKQLYFFDDKECNLKTAFELLRARDVDGTLKQSAANLETCKSSGAKQNNLAHAYYNLGLMLMITQAYTEARANLTEAARLRGGDIVAETLAECQRSESLAAQMRRVEQKTADFEAARAPQTPAAAPPAAGAKSGASIEQRLTDLSGLLSKGLISKEEYEKKKAEILKEM